MQKVSVELRQCKVLTTTFLIGFIWIYNINICINSNIASQVRDLKPTVACDFPNGLVFAPTSSKLGVLFASRKVNVSDSSVSVPG